MMICSSLDLFNVHWDALDFDLPPLLQRQSAAGGDGSTRPWNTPDDIVEAAAAPPLPATQYRVAPRSVVALFSGTSRCAGSLQ
jgi:hypothetical protein